ncbi:hypothetical protein Hanom_Chr16g01472411 [Helianthus anomalus]
MASNKNDMLIQFFKLTESEIDKFCLDHGIDPSLETQVPGERTANQCPHGFLVFYTRILDQPNLRVRLLLFPPLLVILMLGKNQFSFIFDQLLPINGVPRKFSEGLNEKEPEDHELGWELLLRLHAYRTKLRAYPEELSKCANRMAGVPIENPLLN